jgi:hypothetical protein
MMRSVLRPLLASIAVLVLAAALGGASMPTSASTRKPSV